jgi:hypothetical protein
MSTHAERIKMCRARQKAGRAVVMFETDIEWWVRVLSKAGCFTPDAQTLSAATAKFADAVIQQHIREHGDQK